MWQAARPSRPESKGKGVAYFSLLIAILIICTTIVTSLVPLETIMNARRLGSWYFRLALTVKSLYLAEPAETELNGFLVTKSSRTVSSNCAEIEIINYHISEGDRHFDFELIGEITDIL
ncbi:hypothetical protein V511_08305 [Mesotoga sp. Brook.08.YT.4.2.5.1]|jgi:hypothetical protein|uniref:hypothetical protein n=1 Tax=unclassified Mesotoga TaxID=1184398 RepID=UPI000C17FB1B|nr:MULTISPECIES: hypothetical protein [unclassified Mesotoga]PNE22529.1 hypothetical protein V511_08305 [Mesotoga sp. Brook.08.YT.4.2.5.1]PXF34525.1 hypothetical protein EU77_07185 [Mesotoga sp. SC_NapDC]RAM60187.1 hypothetical protein DS66_09305 [Mesotoga sp. SC_3PWM13N19]RAO96669.1 hypothetical protein M388_13390 [Mesotoga sp. Brook.08.YT.4.2.5.4.]PVD16299.1 hypothetical protein V512_005050 [Mesotoga sp. Brook.08.105.5.1]